MLDDTVAHAPKTTAVLTKTTFPALRLGTSDVTECRKPTTELQSSTRSRSWEMSMVVKGSMPAFPARLLPIRITLLLGKYSVK